MDALWAFRSAYNEARKVKQQQDDFCFRAEAGLWDELTHQQFPNNLQWEMLVDVLRGRVKASLANIILAKPIFKHDTLTDCQSLL